MELLHQAIVLQTPSVERNGYIFFDYQLGTIHAHLYKKGQKRALSRGALVQYTRQHKGNWHAVTSVEIVAIPNAWAGDTIFFLHHLLELIDFFVPRGNAAENIFNLMEMLYVPLHDIDIPFFQKIFLCKFFIMIGIYPEPRDLHEREFLSLLAGSRIPEQKYVFLEKKMIQWLRECILLHPHANRFKTMLTEPWCAYEKNTNTG